MELKRQESSSLEELDVLQTRLDDCSQRLSEQKKLLSERLEEAFESLFEPIRGRFSMGNAQVTSRELSEKLLGVERLFEAYRRKAAGAESSAEECESAGELRRRALKELLKP